MVQLPLCDVCVNVVNKRDLHLIWCAFLIEKQGWVKAEQDIGQVILIDNG